ncbi:hypothetical protein BLA23254_07639 [Burkholderia lata]|uniref:Uncharacterized protein n=1 Tax=Burkholderia lata (strain ATCC 17760 / DSM 23089 / LMG 22485 / NCIMB 9086 / R18194 / 383) TaxID=482957 RepID=A0A6P2SVQ4_BURL3|nr:hypothetical protein BLA23254_07639 [Burkholderia lata]
MDRALLQIVDARGGRNAVPLRDGLNVFAALNCKVRPLSQARGPFRAGQHEIIEQCGPAPLLLGNRQPRIKSGLLLVWWDLQNPPP